MEKVTGRGVGGVGPNGHAARHTDPKLDNPRAPIGWLPKAAATSNPQGTAYVKIGPNSQAWDATGSGRSYTTGGQSRGTPKR
jgi:hypothetical protein